MAAIEHRAIERIEISKLKSAPRNPRTHSKRQLEQIAKSIQRFGFTNPILIDDENRILAGHGRLAAARELSLTHAPCVRLSNLSASERRAYVIADNKIAENAGWDKEILALEFQDLQGEGFDLTVTGFELVEVDVILSEASEASTAPAGPEDEHPEPQSLAVTRKGDLWALAGC